MEAAKAKISAAQIALQSSQTNLNNLLTSKTSIEQEVASIQASLDAAKQNVNDLTATKSAKDSAVIDAQNKLSELQASLDQANQRLSDLKSQLAIAQSQTNSSSIALSLSQQQLDTAQNNLLGAKQLYGQTQNNKTLAVLNLAISQTNLDQAQINYNDAVSVTEVKGAVVDSTNNAMLMAEQVLNQAQVALSDAQTAVNLAQSNYDTQLITTTTPSGSGLSVDIYNNIISRTPEAWQLCKHITVPDINAVWGGGPVFGCNSDWVSVHYYGTLTVPNSGIYYFRNIADDGFWMALDGQVVINEWRDKGCSGGWYATQLQAGHAYNLDAWFYENGGGACSTLYYLNNNNWAVVPSAWFGQTSITTTSKDPALLAILQDKQSLLTSAQQNYDTAVSSYNASVDAYNTAQTNYADAVNNYLQKQSELATAKDDKDIKQGILNAAIAADDEALKALNLAQQDYDAATTKLSNDSQTNQSNIANEQSIAQQVDQQAAIVNSLISEVTHAQEVLQLAINEQQDAQIKLSNAETEYSSIQENFAQTESKLEGIINDITAQQADVNTKQQELNVAQQELEAIPPFREPTPTPTPSTQPSQIPTTPEPVTTPTPEQIPTPEIQPKLELPVDPQSLSPAEVSQLVSIANEVLATATQGSPEYNKALDALFVAAQADDIQVDPALAAIPGVGQAAVAAIAAINFMGNVGSDMAPATREKAKKEVVAAVVATGAAVSAATGAATSTTSSGPSGGSGGSSGGNSGGNEKTETNKPNRRETR